MADDSTGRNTERLVQIDDKTKYLYLALLVVCIALLALGICFKSLANVVIAIPVILILAVTLIRDKKFVHVPPFIILLVVISMIFTLIADYFNGTNEILDALADILKGVVLGTGGLILAYMALGQLPGFAKEKPGLIALESFSIGVTVATIWMIFTHFISGSLPEITDIRTLDDMIFHLTCVSVGAAAISLLFYLDIHDGHYKMAIIGFLDDNSQSIGINTDEKEEIQQLIDRGESYDLEFKSTIRVNLKTGEKDKRIEKAVLKTLVAFLNSDGGTLLVGVEDDGNILGVDVEGFDNRDKMNLHITNMLSSQIGDEFIPFIKFKQVDFGKKENGADKIVIRFVCKPTSTPVFLKDGKQEIYFIRSGPSSVELTGVNLLKYAENRKKTGLRRHTMPRQPSSNTVQPESDENKKEGESADKPQ